MTSILGHTAASEWKNNAACTGNNSGSVFYAPLHPEPKAMRLRRERRAKALCASCPVRETCLEQAIAVDERFGIWGGMTRRERNALAAHVA